MYWRRAVHCSHPGQQPNRFVMRLINTRTLQLEEFIGTAVPNYVILSHTWGDGEVSLDDMQNNPDVAKKKGYVKIKYTCEQARRDHFDHAWVDTCCIDKRSSAELQEAINSMYRWYSDAKVCYVYLSDIVAGCPPLFDWQTKGLRTALHSMSKVEKQNVSEKFEFWHGAFAASVWFTRGWTLQELIAPRVLKFYGNEWNLLGTRGHLSQLISDTTGIPESILKHTHQLRSESVARRMSWASKRRTSRIEDQAYCLLGIFDVNMPMLYGEGSKAFIRLQEEIIRSTSDHSIFAWDSKACDRGCLLAESPADFAGSRAVVLWGTPESFEMTNRGLRMMASMVQRPSGGPRLKATMSSSVVNVPESTFVEHLVPLNCRLEHDFSGTLALRVNMSADVQEYQVCADDEGASPHSNIQSSRLTSVADYRAQKQMIQVSRKRQTHTTEPTFWVRFLHDDAIWDSMVDILDNNPRDQWTSNKTMRARMHEFTGGKYMSTRGQSVFRLPSGMEVLLVFGCDEVSFVDSDNGVRGCIFIPGVYAWHNEMRAQLRDLNAYVNPCNHEGCLWKGECPNTPKCTTMFNSLRQEAAVITITEECIMETKVFVISVQITEKYELDASMPRQTTVDVGALILVPGDSEHRALEDAVAGDTQKAPSSTAAAIADDTPAGWEPPLTSSGRVRFPAKGESRPKADVLDLPSGWKQRLAPKKRPFKGRPFYVYRSTSYKTWEHPRQRQIRILGRSTTSAAQSFRTTSGEPSRSIDLQDSAGYVDGILGPDRPWDYDYTGTLTGLGIESSTIHGQEPRQADGSAVGGESLY